MICANCGALIAVSTPNGTGENSCAPCARAGIIHGYERTTLTRGEALEEISEAADSMEALQDLATGWIGNSDHGYADTEAYADFLRDYIAEACLTDDVREHGPSDQDDTGIPTCCSKVTK